MEVQLALEDLVDVGKVLVDRSDLGGDLFKWEVTFISTRFDSWDIPALTSDVNLLTGTAAAVTVEGGDNAIGDIDDFAAVSCAGCVVGETPSAYAFTLVPSAYRSASIDGLDAGETYTVRVTAVNARGLGAAAEPYPETTLPLQAPSVPLLVTADVDFGMPHNIQVTYSAPASDGGSPIQKYKLEWCKLEAGASASECFSGRPESGTVVNSAGQQLDSNNVRCPTYPRRQVHILETAQANANAITTGAYFTLKLTRGGVVGYTGPIAYDAKAMRSQESVADVDVFCNDDGSSTGAFTCEAGPSAPRGSVQSHLEALHDINGNILSQITYDSVEVNRVDRGNGAYKWFITFHDDGDDFDLDVNTDDGLTDGTVTTVTEFTGYVYAACTGTVTIINTLENGVEYLVRVLAANRIGYSPGAVIAQAQKPMVVPDPPHSVALAVQSDTSLRVTFLAPQDDPDSLTRADGGDTITEYIVEADEAPTFDSGSTQTFNAQYDFSAQHVGRILYLEAGGTFVYTFTGLTMGTYYYVQVRAYNSQGYGSPQVSTPALESPKRVPSGPQNVYVHITSHQLLTIQIVYPGDTGGEDASNFKIEHDTQYGQDSFETPPNKAMNIIAAPEVPGDASSPPDAYFTVEGLSNVINYFVRVSAANSMGYGSPTVSVPSYTMPKLEVPGLPTQVQVTTGGVTGEITITWSPPVIPAHGIPCSGTYSNPGPCPNTMGRGSEADGGAAIDSYYVEYNESPTFDSAGAEDYVAAELEAGASYSYDITGLDSDRTYYIRVRAQNSEGTGGNCGNEADSDSGRCTGAQLSANPAT